MSNLTWRQKLLKATQFRAEDRIALYARLGTLVRNDVGVAPAMELLYARYLKRKDLKAGLLKSWLYGMRQGHGISMVMADWVTPGERIMLEAAETSGKLGESLQETERMLESITRIKSMAISKSVMPLMILLTILAALIGLSMNLIPVFQEIDYPKENWEGGVLLADWVYRVIYQHLLVLILLVGGFVGLIAFSMPWFSHPIRYRVLDKIPPYSIYRAFQGSTVMVALSTMLSSGVPIDTALKKVQGLSSNYIRVQIELVLQRLRAGSHPKEALQIDLFDDEMKDDIFIYSQFGDFDTAMKRMSNNAINQAEQAVSKAVGAANKYIGFGGALVMLWIMSSVVLTLLSMTDSLSF